MPSSSPYGDARGVLLVRGSGAPPHTPLLELTGVCKNFEGVRALRGVDLVLSSSGTVHALVGENGSGKSTLLGVLSGLVQPDTGSIRMRGEEVMIDRPAEAIRRGIIAVAQETAVAPQLSVTENVLMGRLPRRRGAINWSAAHNLASRVLQRIGMTCDCTAPVHSLRADERQMVEIGRALAMAPRVLILDEPTSSLTEDEVESVLQAVRRLKEHDVATILVTHRLREMFAVADEITVLRDGETVAFGAAEDFTADSIVATMLGPASEVAGERRQGDSTEAGAVPKQTPVLRVHDVFGRGFANASFEVYPGEIVGLAGLVGSGRDDLLRAIFGVLPKSSGTMEVDGADYSPRTPADAISCGVGYVPPERKSDGLVLEMTVRDNMAMVVTATAHGLRHDAQYADALQKTLSRLRIRSSALEARAGTLSGGNQQKVTVAKWLLKEVRVLLLSEPTRGVDVVSRQQIHASLRELAASGVALLISSSENPELLEICHRIHVMFAGQIVASFDRNEVDEHRLAIVSGGHQ